ncbi:MAG: bactofilin family protein [Treponema sp.]
MVEAEKIDLAELDDEDYDTFLAQDVAFDGSIQFEKPFIIKGCVKGAIQSNSDLMISEHALVEANITADRIVIKGTVTGNVTAVTSIHIFPTGKLTGDITASEVILDSGSFFSGVCTMTRQ